MPLLWSTGTTEYECILFALWLFWTPDVSGAVLYPSFLEKSHSSPLLFPIAVKEHSVTGDIFHGRLQDEGVVWDRICSDNRSWKKTERCARTEYSERTCFHWWGVRYDEFHLGSEREGSEWYSFLWWVPWNHSGQKDIHMVFHLQKRRIHCQTRRTKRKTLGWADVRDQDVWIADEVRVSASEEIPCYRSYIDDFALLSAFSYDSAWSSDAFWPLHILGREIGHLWYECIWVWCVVHMTWLVW